MTSSPRHGSGTSDERSRQADDRGCSGNARYGDCAVVRWTKTDLGLNGEGHEEPAYVFTNDEPLPMLGSFRPEFNAAAEQELHGRECQAGLPCTASNGKAAAADCLQHATAIPDSNVASTAAHAPAPPL
jgi:hypothetical protein